MMRKQCILFLSVLQNHCMLKVMMYHNLYWAKLNLGLLWWLSGKESTCSVGDLGSIPGLKRSPGGGHGNSLQYFGHLKQRVDSLEKTLMLGGIGGRIRRGQQRLRWLDGITNSMYMSPSELRE